MVKIYDSCYFSMSFLGKIKSSQACVDHQNVLVLSICFPILLVGKKNKKKSWNYLQYTIERKEIKEMEKERCKKGWSEFGFSMWLPSAD